MYTILHNALLNNITCLYACYAYSQQRFNSQSSMSPTDLQKWLLSCQSKNGRIKKPLNVYMIWLYLHRPVLKQIWPQVNSKEITIQLGRVWAKLSDAQKSPYVVAAQKLKHMHQQKYPGMYKYSANTIYS